MRPLLLSNLKRDGKRILSYGSLDFSFHTNEWRWIRRSLGGVFSQGKLSGGAIHGRNRRIS